MQCMSCSNCHGHAPEHSGQRGFRNIEIPVRVDKNQPDTPRITSRIVFEPRKHTEQIVAVRFQANRDHIVPRSFTNRIGKIRIRQRHAIPLTILTLLLRIQANVLNGPNQLATPFTDKSLEPCSVNVVGVGR